MRHKEAAEKAVEKNDVSTGKQIRMRNMAENKPDKKAESAFRRYPYQLKAGHAGKD